VSRKRLIVVGPVPPPHHGVTVSTSLVVSNEELRERFELRHLDTSDHRARANIGKWEPKNIWLAVRAVAQLARLLRGERGVVYLPLSQSAPGLLRDSMFVMLASVRGWTVAIHLRGSEFQRFYGNSGPILRRWIRTTLAHVDAVAVLGESLRGAFDGLVPRDKISVVGNGTPEPGPTDAARDPQHVLFLSNLRRRKGVVQAIDAALIVLRSDREARFTFVGAWEDAELERELRARADAANGQIEFRPPASGREKDRLLASAAVLLFPPIEPEGHPRVVLEAIAAGVPVVATDRGAIRETIEDEVSGFVLPDADPAELADRVLRLLQDADLRDRQSKAARARYLGCFTQAHADRRLAEWLGSVADAPRC
jgi:glycosyltransferase involved in cell wall biosynthesis